MEIIKALKKVFSDKKYIFYSVLVALTFYSLNAIIADFQTIKNFYPTLGFLTGLKFTFLNISGFHYRILTHSFVSLIIISILFGILFSFLIYKTKTLKSQNSGEKMGFFATIGIFLGVLAPGCAACGIGIASALGLGAFVTFLPYDGLELSILAIILLLVANWRVSKGLLNQNSCEIKLKVNNVKGGK